MPLFYKFKEDFFRGSGTVIMGTFMIVGIFAFILMFMEVYQVRENYINTKAATDTIADGAAIYAENDFDSNYASVNNKVNEISSVINNELGVNVGTVDISKDDYDSDRIITANTNYNYDYLTNLFSSSQYNLSTTSATKFINPLYLVYGIPGEALSDETVRKMLEAIEKIRPTTTYSQAVRTKPGVSLDCSSFVCYALDSVGLWDISTRGYGNTEDLLTYCTRVSSEDAKPGDLIFFTGNPDHIYNVGHVGIYLGDNTMVHCSSAHNCIEYTSSVRSNFLCYGRIPGRDTSN